MGLDARAQAIVNRMPAWLNRICFDRRGLCQPGFCGRFYFDVARLGRNQPEQGALAAQNVM
jgi:hypothetical protein